MLRPLVQQDSGAGLRKPAPVTHSGFPAFLTGESAEVVLVGLAGFNEAAGFLGEIAVNGVFGEHGVHLGSAQAVEHGFGDFAGHLGVAGDGEAA